MYVLFDLWVKITFLNITIDYIDYTYHNIYLKLISPWSILFPSYPLSNFSSQKALPPSLFDIPILLP